MAALLDNVRFNPTAGGTGDWTVSTAVTGYQLPSAASAGNGVKYKYFAFDPVASVWEIGEGAYNTTGPVLPRTNVLYNSSGTGSAPGQSGAGTKINFANVPSVAIIGLAEDVAVPALVPEVLFGLTLSTAGSSATFSVAAGTTVNSTHTDFMALAASINKTTGAWAVGTGNGALDTGAIANSTWYHVFLIKRPDTLVVDVLISLSATAPTLPTNYTLFRRIGAMRTTGAALWVLFYQNGDEFLWDVPIADASALAITNTASTITLTIPTGVSLVANIQIDYTNTISPSTTCLISSPLQTTQISGTPGGNWSAVNPIANQFYTSPIFVRTNTSAQIKAVGDQAANNSLFVITRGWTDRRGKDV